MNEHVARALYYVEIHLLYASIVWFAAWMVTSIPRGSATAKYWIWVAASLNFVVPLGAVVDAIWASQLTWAAPLGAVGDVAAGIAQSATVGTIVCATWLLGATLMFVRLIVRVRAGRQAAAAVAARGTGEPKRGFRAHGVPVRFAVGEQGPAVDGILHPQISLPHGIDRLLSEHELSAVLIHEVTHAKRRDNLIRLVHELALCVLWFHPLVWVTGSRLAVYRELSCDESVIESARGADLVSALAKIACHADAFFLQATALSFMGHRLARLTTARPGQTCLAANALLTVAFGSVVLAGVLGTVAHTACCFIARS